MRKGRQKGQTKAKSIINDPLIAPLHNYSRRRSICPVWIVKIFPQGIL
jgi:hypothetical protein